MLLFLGPHVYKLHVRMLSVFADHLSQQCFSCCGSNSQAYKPWLLTDIVSQQKQSPPHRWQQLQPSWLPCWPCLHTPCPPAPCKWTLKNLASLPQLEEHQLIEAAVNRCHAGFQNSRRGLNSVHWNASSPLPIT